ncbi:MAG: arginase [Cognatishimia sp.]
MTPKTCILIGAPVDSGKMRRGCLMGPDSYRTAGLAQSLGKLGHTVIDEGNLIAANVGAVAPDANVHNWAETIGWTHAISDAAQNAMARGFPIFLGGDHSLSAGSVLGVSRYAATQNRPQFVLWLDAHSDYHTPETTDSGNLHGTPVAYFTGRDGFDGFPKLDNPVPQENVCIIGLRSVDLAERNALQASSIHSHDMREIDEAGIAKPLTAFLERVAAANGMLHVSLDVDFLDPSFAPAVGTTVPGGATVREAHLVMELLHDSNLMTSLDLVELNPFLDERGRTAKMMVDLAASSLGRRIFDRPTRSY